MNGQVQKDEAACAHLHVDRFRVEDHGKVFEEQWRCRECGLKFVALDSLFAGPQKIQVMEPIKTLRDEFAMAAMLGFLSTGDWGISLKDEGEQRLAGRSYCIADVMMRARK